MKNKLFTVLLALIICQAGISQQYKTITYPRKDVKPEDVFNQKTLEKSINYIFSWQQAAGAFGDLTTFSTWGDDGVIGRRYHGQFTSHSSRILQIMLSMYDETGDKIWKRRAEDIVSNMMYLQAKSGGFIQASAENGPSYSEETTCVIHQNLIIQGLLKYAGKEYANPDLKDEIHKVIDKHWIWFIKKFNQRGTPGGRKVEGWPWRCFDGVTNQDLNAIHALALYGKVYGDMSRYEEFGKPVLDVLLSDRYYYKGLGLFERGDNTSWKRPETTHYYYYVFGELKAIYEITNDQRIPEVLEDVCKQLFRATYVGEDGLRYFAYLANIIKENNTVKVIGYDKYPIDMGDHFALMKALDWYLEQHPDSEKQKIRDEIYQTAAAYVFANGTISRNLNPKKDILALTPDLYRLPMFLLSKLKGKIHTFEVYDTPAIQRKYKDFIWYEKGQFYWVDKAEKRVFAGFKSESRSIVIGTDEKLPAVEFEKAKTYSENEEVIIEVLDFRYSNNTKIDIEKK